jgi:molybdopterin/thiamine biosynthesis adenylyltransferase
MADEPCQLARFARQMVFEPLGLDGQKALARGRVMIVGLGGLGSWVAELLTRAGVGFLRIADDDLVDITNIHRQALYDEADAESRRPKVSAAADRLRHLRAAVQIEPVAERISHRNIERLASGSDVIVDGTDNFATRFLINDYCIKTGTPWVFAGAVRAEAQTAVIIPDRTPCLRCILPEPPPVCRDPNCRVAGVMGMALSAIASFQAMETVKILSGRQDAVSPYLLKLNLWTNEIQRLLLSDQRDPHCPCCGLRDFEYLDL